MLDQPSSAAPQARVLLSLGILFDQRSGAHLSECTARQDASSGLQVTPEVPALMAWCTPLSVGRGSGLRIHIVYQFLFSCWARIPGRTTSEESLFCASRGKVHRGEESMETEKEEEAGPSHLNRTLEKWD